MYWADWTKTTIMTTDKDIGLGLEYIVNNTYHVSDLKIYSKTSQSCKLQSFSSSLISLCFQFWSFGMIKINLHCDYNMYIFTGHSKLNAVKTIPLAMSKYCIEIDSTFVVLRTYRVSIWFFQLIFLPDLRCSVLNCNFLFLFKFMTCNFLYCSFSAHSLCTNGNGACTQLCLPRPQFDGTGAKLSKQNRTCACNGNSFKIPGESGSSEHCKCGEKDMKINGVCVPTNSSVG